MSLAADSDVAPNVGVVLVFLQEVVAADEDLTQPFEDLGVVEDLVLNKLLRDGEKDLGTEIQNRA